MAAAGANTSHHVELSVYGDSIAHGHAPGATLKQLVGPASGPSQRGMPAADSLNLNAAGSWMDAANNAAAAAAAGAAARRGPYVSAFAAASDGGAYAGAGGESGAGPARQRSDPPLLFGGRGASGDGAAALYPGAPDFTSQQAALRGGPIVLLPPSFPDTDYSTLGFYPQPNAELRYPTAGLSTELQSGDYGQMQMQTIAGYGNVPCKQGSQDGDAGAGYDYACNTQQGQFDTSWAAARGDGAAGSGEGGDCGDRGGSAEGVSGGRNWYAATAAAAVAGRGGGGNGSSDALDIAYTGDPDTVADGADDAADARRATRSRSFSFFGFNGSQLGRTASTRSIDPGMFASSSPGLYGLDGEAGPGSVKLASRTAPLSGVGGASRGPEEETGAELLDNLFYGWTHENNATPGLVSEVLHMHFLMDNRGCVFHAAAAFHQAL